MAWPGDFAATLTLARAADGSGAVTNAGAQVTADADGRFGFAVPLPVEELLAETGDAYLVAAFTDGTRATTLPAQRVGYATYSVHAGEVHEAIAESVTLSSLAVTNLSAAGEATVGKVINVRGAMIVTNGVTFVKNGLAAISVDRLNLTTGETRFLSGSSTAGAVACADGDVQSLVWTAEMDSMLTVTAEVPEGALLSLSVARVATDGAEETLFGRTLSGGGVRKLGFPACAGDVISISGTSFGGSARLALAVRTFGVKMEDE